MKIFRRTTLFIFTSATFLITGCRIMGVTGNYSEKMTPETAARLDRLGWRSAKPMLSAPMHLNVLGGVRWTYYRSTTATVSKVFNYGKWRREGDTLFIQRCINDGSQETAEEYTLAYLIQGDTLTSLEWDRSYVKYK